MNGLVSGKCFLILILESKKRRFTFLKKLNQDSPSPLEFNDNEVQTIDVHNHIGLSLDKKFDFYVHIDNKINKCNKLIGIMKQLSPSIYIAQI